MLTAFLQPLSALAGHGPCSCHRSCTSARAGPCPRLPPCCGGPSRQHMCQCCGRAGMSWFSWGLRVAQGGWPNPAQGQRPSPGSWVPAALVSPPRSCRALCRCPTCQPRFFSEAFELITSFTAEQVSMDILKIHPLNKQQTESKSRPFQ